MVDTTSLEKIDSFPYRHRVAEVMSSPVATVSPATTIGDASRAMADGGVSSLVVVDAGGCPAGIVTERDVLRALASHRQEAVDMAVAAVMSRPVATVRQDAFVYVAMGRMDRLRLRHLVAVDAAGRATGMVTVRGLLHLRAGAALAFGDEIATAASAADMAAVRARVPSLADGLLAEGVGGLGVAAVASSVLRDMTMRAAQLAELSMAADGRGSAPAAWCLLLLGSGGRRESLFGADQDNAIVHAGGEADDAWFAEAGSRINATLAAAGVPLCKGGVMARNAEWRRSVEGWRGEIDRWMKEADGPELLNVDIFVDFRPVHGDYGLAQQVRDHLMKRAAASSRFLHLMAASVSDLSTPLGVLGQFKTKNGRLDIKLHGLLPLVSATRLLALKHRIPETGTAERLRGLARGGFMPEHEARGYMASHELMVRVLLEQQIADRAAGIEISNLIEVKRLAPEDRHRLKAAFHSIDSLKWVLRSALSTV